MKLVVITHKLCWVNSEVPSGYATDGGFPFHMEALSELFDKTTIVAPIHKLQAPPGTSPIIGHNISVLPLKLPHGFGLLRKLSLLLWIPGNLPKIWRAIEEADAVHTPLGSDIGTLGVFVALLQRKPLYIRYCGHWGRAMTFFQRFWFWLFDLVAGGRNVVLATGWDNHQPSLRNSNIQWIFSTSLREREFLGLPRRLAWESGQELKLITVGRLEPLKNTALVIQALQLVREHYPNTTLDIVGDGTEMSRLQALTSVLGLSESVTFHGYVNHRAVIDILLAADLLCFPSQSSEGFPKAVLEAMACGLPVVATPVSVLKYIITARNGVLLKDVRPETIADAILSIIRDPQRFAAMSVTAQELASQYTLERWRDEIGVKLQTAWKCNLRTN